MDRNHLSVEVRVNGRKLREYQHTGEIWVEGRKNSDFTIRVRNDSDIRVLAVPSVDGLSVMDGEVADFDSSGYVINAHSYLDIPGWRLNDEEVAKFRFGKSNKAYAAKTGLPRNIGVIGVAIFNEEIAHTAVYHNFSHEIERGGGQSRGGAGGQSCGSPGATWTMSISNSATAPSSTETTTGGFIPDSTVMNTTEPSLGTEFGKKATHQVVTTTFTKANKKPENVFQARYADKQELISRGVDMRQTVVAANSPTAFPGEENCAPPADWNG